MATEITLRPTLIPYKRITGKIARTIRIGENFLDLARLGLIGEYIEVPATDICPRLFYRWNGIVAEWEIYAIDNDLIGYNLGAIGDAMEDIADLEIRMEKVEEIVDPTEEPTEEPTESPTESPTEEPTEEPTEAPQTMSIIELDKHYDQGKLIGVTIERNLILNGSMRKYPVTVATPVEGNYAIIVIHSLPDYWLNYKNEVVVTYKGAKYTKEWFTPNGDFVLYINFRDPNQLMPIRIDWTEGITENFAVIAHDVTLEDFIQ